MKPHAFTIKFIEGLTPQSKPYDVRDTQVRGPYIRVYPTGSKTYRCECKRGKTITIGRTDTLTITQARQEALQLLAKTAQGIDPILEKKQKKLDSKMTFALFLENEYLPSLKVSASGSWQETIRDLRKCFVKEFGNFPISELSKTRILAWREKRKKETRTRVKVSLDGKPIKAQEAIRPYTVNKSISRLKTLLNLAIKLGYLAKNPIEDILPLDEGETERCRFLNKSEYQRLYQALLDREEEKNSNEKIEMDS